MTTTVLDGAHVATVDAAGTEYRSGHVVLDGARIVAVGDGPAPALDGATRVDAAGLLVTPGLVNSHHHLYQWLTRGYATDDTLFGWLTTLYPIWARLTPELVHAAASANLAWLALTGCTTSMDHHYVHPRGAGDLLEAEIRAAQRIGLRFHPTRGSMNLGESDGGLPPDSVVEEHDAILAASAAAIERWHDPAPDSMLRDRARAVLAVLGDGRADARQRGAGPREGRAAAHPPGRDRRRGGVLPRDVRPHADAVRRGPRLARRRRVDGPLRAPVRRRGGALRGDRHRRRALPDLQRAARRGHRAGAQAARRRCARRPRRRRLGLERVGPHGRRAAPVGARRALPRRPAGAGAARGPADGDDGRRPLPRPRRRAGLARGRQAGRPRAVAGVRPAGRGHRRPGEHPRARRGRRSTASTSAAGASSPTGSCRPPTPTRWPPDAAAASAAIAGR